ncbi:MAG TPA: 3-deoxy-7-phosphoheptulonate synthase class II [Bryobacteraceae bacterium]|nr:3-deoxy-7-phosphoheptulonate synthase class II [Bryobacteraceae bacterium]HXJ41365.1 3-deoxy-7-phosphoheptulonate synthase class II [Bryobacteraceae bacterium]
MPPWSPGSWRSKPATQQVSYASETALSLAVSQLASLPPLVTSWEVESLKRQLAEAAQGKRFLLQGGDCAEQFDDCTAGTITNKLKILLQMSLVLVQGSGKPVIRVGRFAGQYAKPRSEDSETRNGTTLPSYRGDLVNRAGFTEAARKPDPQLLLRAYERSALTLNFIRSLVKGGFADLHHPEYWDLDFARHSPLAGEYHAMAHRVVEALQFMENVGGVRAGETGWVDFFTSHEGLHLVYEEAQTRQAPRREGWYNLSTHFPWIGMRTADPAGAHAEYFRGIANPIGVKIGSDMTPEGLVRLLDILHPHDEAGRLTLIHRFGHARIGDCLPQLIEAVRASGKIVLWCCDPMHGNTRHTSDGVKTRHFDDILRELEQAFSIHRACGSCLGGVHFELTGDDVTECLGGARNLSDNDLKRAYRSEVDPRLNYEQSLEMAMLIARMLRQGATPVDPVTAK